MEFGRTGEKPNIVLILADNLGWGELGCYGGGDLRGAPTPRIDRLSTQGMQFLNFNVESDCVPTRSALMTGRHPIRTGAMQSLPAGLLQGLIPWEITLAELLSKAGYVTAMFGKWHLGDKPGRYPHERGFDEWYGIPRTTDESMFTSSLGFDSTAVQLPYVMEGFRGKAARQVHIYDLESRRCIDAELVRRGRGFIARNCTSAKPFFLYLPVTQLHYPTIPHRDFAGKTHAGEFGDSVTELDYRVGEVLDEIDARGLGDNTLFLFGSDNGPEFRRPWRGSAGVWRGTYHTAMEGALRVPFIARWPGRVPVGVRTNEIVHITDLFPTLAKIAGADLPDDRPIDGVDQLELFKGQQPKSAREGFCYYIKTELRAVKWRHWKMHFVWEVEPNEGARRLEAPFVFNLLKDPKEETDVDVSEGWVWDPIRKMVDSFQKSLKEHPPIPPGAADDFRPEAALRQPG